MGALAPCSWCWLQGPSAVPGTLMEPWRGCGAGRGNCHPVLPSLADSDVYVEEDSKYEAVDPAVGARSWQMEEQLAQAPGSGFGTGWQKEARYAGFCSWLWEETVI